MKQRDLWDETVDELVNEAAAKIPMPILNRMMYPEVALSLLDSLNKITKVAKANDERYLRVIRGIKRAITDEDYTVAWLLCEAVLRQEVGDENK